MEIESPDFELTPAIRKHCTSCFEKLSKRHPAVKSTLHLHKSGVNYSLSWSYVISGKNPVVIKDTGHDLYSLIGAAASKMNRALTKSEKKGQ